MRLFLAILLAMSLPPGPAAARDLRVDVELMLAVDVSRSMSPRELEIQRRGYAEALRHPAVLAAIGTGFHKQIALTYVEWSGTNSQRIIVGWRLIRTAKDLHAVADRLTAKFDPSLRRTSISGVLDYAPLSFGVNGFKGDRRIIDISGDGPNNMGPPVRQARDRAVRRGFVINGLPLMTREGVNAWMHLEDLDLYYRHCVIGGATAFMIPVKSWKDFPSAVRRKLVLELAAPRARLIPANWRGARPDGSYDCLIGEKMWQRFMQDRDTW